MNNKKMFLVLGTLLVIMSGCTQETGNGMPESSGEIDLDALSARGEELFTARVSCWVCHGDNAEGGVGPTLHHGPTPLDIQEQRLKIALELGASQGINLNQENDPVAAIHTLTGGKGVDYSLDTTNQPEVVRQAFESLANRGTCIHSGGGGKDLSFPGSHLLQGRTVTGVLQGDSDPGVFIPQLLEYYRQGKFPFDRLLSFYPLAEINQAVEDMQQGKVVKPVLRM